MRRHALTAVILLLAGPAWGERSTSCQESGSEVLVTYHAPSGTQHDITFHLAQDRPTTGAISCADVFTFLNGDRGVQAPVTLNAIDPAPISCPGLDCRNGWQVDFPVSEELDHLQGFDGRPHFTDEVTGVTVSVNFSEDLFGGALPRDFTGSSSIVKGVSGTPDCGASGTHCLEYAAVLSVMQTAPADPANTFRMPVQSATKPTTLPVFSDLDFSNGWSRLDCADLQRPSMDQIAARYEEFQIGEQMDTSNNRAFHARDNSLGEEYHADIGASNGTAAMAMSCAGFYPYTGDGKRAIVAYVQYGYDLAWAFEQGFTMDSHSMGRQIAAAVAAHLLQDPVLIDAVQNRPGIGGREKWNYHESSLYPGRYLWGETTCFVHQYWDYYYTGLGNKNCADPYEEVDGPISYAGCCYNSSAYAGTLGALATGVTSTLNRTAMIEVAYRFYKTGLVGEPDPCLRAGAGGGDVDGTGAACIPGGAPGEERWHDGPCFGGINGTSYCGFVGYPLTSLAETVDVGEIEGQWYAFAAAFKYQMFDCLKAGTCPGLGKGILPQLDGGEIQ